MEIARVGVVEGPSAYSDEAVLAIELAPEAGESACRHRMSAFHELVVTAVRSILDPGSLREGIRPLPRPWRDSLEELIAFTIRSLHRAAGLLIESRAVENGRERRRIIVSPAGSRATRRAVEVAVEAFRDFSAGNTVDIQAAVQEIRQLGNAGPPRRKPAPAA